MGAADPALGPLLPVQIPQFVHVSREPLYVLYRLIRGEPRIYHRLGPWFEVEHGLRTEQPVWVETGLAGIRSRL